MENKTGPKIEPCGMPVILIKYFLKTLNIITLYMLYQIILNHSVALKLIPIFRSLFSNKLWFTESNASDKSTNKAAQC